MGRKEGTEGGGQVAGGRRFRGQAIPPRPHPAGARPADHPAARQELTGDRDGASSNAPTVLVLHEEATASIKDVPLTEDVVLLVGPEGGIGDAELDRLKEAGATPIKLGPEVLRTASAAMVALAAIGMRTERW